jgi:hypothetical protein
MPAADSSCMQVMISGFLLPRWFRMDSCRLRNPEAALMARYWSPIARSTSAMKSEPGWVMKVSLGSFFSAAALAAGFSAAAESAACASCVVAASVAPAAAAAPFRNERRLTWPSDFSCGSLLMALSRVDVRTIRTVPIIFPGTADVVAQ